MTVREFLGENVLLISEMVKECRKLNEKEYAEFKEHTINGTPELVRPFMRKVFLVIDEQLKTA